MTAQPPLRRFQLCVSDELGPFAAQLDRVYYPSRLRMPVRPQLSRSPSVLNAIHRRDFTIGYVRPRTDMQVVPEGDRPAYHVNFAWNGSLGALSGERDVRVRDGVAAVHNPGERHMLHHWQPGTGVVGIKLASEFVEAELTGLLGRAPTEPLRFSPEFLLTEGLGASWLTLARFVIAELDRPGLIEAPGMLQPYVRTLAVALLNAQPHNYSDQLRDPSGPPRTGIVRRAQESIERRYAEPLLVTDIARDAGVSVRRLQETFAEVHGISPKTYLRDYRLEQAHRALRAGQGSVTEVAQACGFNHLGRFAASYRERFGELPSQTLG
ncbi:helix-turn-helix domain-containing protein [Epidermidibacterium keratini]|uniref:Helix-turn-helix domain-containing protein n=1 Tax=Epidermidibacterium keratini TaxID=1891644 RepID=A0A7L4YKK3_9ACTN|nr:AraC family transcriptional regulator [Epidermidibacterium keratini]QHB99794.1 helix-turn-helix domain-containing protein [Epidermidibacterium keratini]